MSDKEQLAALGAEMEERQAPLCMAKQIEQLQSQLADAKEESRKYKLSGLGMAASMGDHVCVREGWKPISTAPKDGANHLLLARFSSHGVLVEVDWDGEWGSYRDGPNDDLFFDWLSHNGINEPTHWMMMPPIQEGGTHS